MINSRFFIPSSLGHRARWVCTAGPLSQGGLQVNLTSGSHAAVPSSGWAELAGGFVRPGVKEIEKMGDG